MSRRLQIGRVASVAVLWLLVASVALAQTPVTITVWDVIPLASRDVYLSIVEDFQREYPHITVEVERAGTGYPSITEKFIVGLMGGVVPNVIHTSHVRSFNLRWQGAFMPINDYIANDPNMDLGDFYPAFIETVSLGDLIYGVPFTVSTPIAYVWPETLHEAGLPGRAPNTWDEIVEFSRRISRDLDGDGNPDMWGMDITREPGWIAEAFIGQAGGSTVTPDGRALAFNSPEGVRAFQFLQDGILVDRIIRYPGAPTEEFYGGRLGWAYRSTADLPTRIERGIEWMHPITAGPLPCDVQCYVPIGGGGFLAVDTGTQEERDASYAFLSFLVRPENVAKYAAASGYMAVRRSALTQPALESVLSATPEYWVTYEQLVYAHPETQAPEWATVLDLWKSRPDFLDPLFINKQPVQLILDDTARRGNAIIAEFLAAFPEPAHLAKQ